MPKVSVIVPNYNYSHYLSDRLNSIAGQTFSDFEIILLDDASSDDSLAIMQEFAAKEPRVSQIVVNEHNTNSPFKQWQKGIELAKGDYIWIAEADDVAHPEFLQRTVEALEQQPDTCIAYSLSELIDSQGAEIPNYIEQQVYPPKPLPTADGSTVIYNGPSYLASLLYAHNTIYNASMVLFRRSAFNRLKTRIFNQMRFVGDWALWSAIALEGNIAEVRMRLNKFRKHQASTTRQSLTAHNRELDAEVALYAKIFTPVVAKILLSAPDFSKSNPLSNSSLSGFSAKISEFLLKLRLKFNRNLNINRLVAESPPEIITRIN